MINSIIKEPLVHFGVIGFCLFILFNWINPNTSDTEIVIDEYDINEIVSKWHLQWKRDPTTDELKGLLDNYIKQEIYYREALSLNMDHNDEIIKRRMAQKMQFLTQDLVEQLEPTNEELLAFLNDNQSRYSTEPLYTFEQIYFSRDSRKNAQRDAERALSENNIVGDPSPTRNSFDSIPLSRVRAELGSEFSSQIATLEVGEKWQGPIKSGLGYHLVKMTIAIPPQSKTLDEVRSKLMDDYHYNELNRINEELFNSLMEKYQVVMEIDLEGY